MECNIDQTGRRVRLIIGMLSLLLGVVLVTLRATGTLTGTWPWIVAAVAILMGGFAIYEGSVGWCAMRAAGVKTPI